jgi:very-short-patch-repair endonuclease
VVREMMGIMTAFLRFWNRHVEKIARKTIKNLKQVASKDRAHLADQDTLLYVRESIMNKLEFSRPVCVKKYLAEKGAAGDALLSKLLLQFT